MITQLRIELEQIVDVEHDEGASLEAIGNRLAGKAAALLHEGYRLNSRVRGVRTFRAAATVIEARPV